VQQADGGESEQDAHEASVRLETGVWGLALSPNTTTQFHRRSSAFIGGLNFLAFDVPAIAELEAAKQYVQPRKWRFSQPSTILSVASAPGMVQGFVQIKVKIPETLPPSYDVHVMLRVGRYTSPTTVTLSVQ
jgi:hypothetical protein